MKPVSAPVAEPVRPQAATARARRRRRAHSRRPRSRRRPRMRARRGRRTGRRRLQPTAPSGPWPDEPPRKRRGRRVWMLFAFLALIVIPLGLGAYIANQAVYFVGTDDGGFVTMYRGLPYELPAGIDLYSPTYVSPVPVDSLSPARRKRLVDHTLRSHDDAADLMRELERGRIGGAS